jgi:hypothetical protein
MSEAEFSEAIGRVFDQEWKRASRWAVVRSFVWGMITGVTISLLARLI